MKRILLTMLVAAAVSVSCLAQELLTGTVVDGHKNPIPGAKVQVVGTDESVITELDGSFTLPNVSSGTRLRVEYAGMNARTLKAKPDMVVKLTNESWWSTPDKYQWFAGAEIAFPAYKAEHPALGVNFGYVKKFGFYGKAMINPDYKTTYYDVDYDDIYDRPAGGPYTGRTRLQFIGGSLGGMWRIGPPIYLMLGAEVHKHNLSWQDIDGDWIAEEHSGDFGVGLELGVMVRYKRIGISGAVHFSPAEWGTRDYQYDSYGIDDALVYGSLGVSYFF